MANEQACEWRTSQRKLLLSYRERRTRMQETAQVVEYVMKATLNFRNVAKVKNVRTKTQWAAIVKVLD